MYTIYLNAEYAAHGRKAVGEAATREAAIAQITEKVEAAGFIVVCAEYDDENDAADVFTTKPRTCMAHIYSIEAA